MPKIQKPRHGRVGGMTRIARSMAVTPAARVEVRTHRMLPPAANLKKINCAPKARPARAPRSSAAGGVAVGFDSELDLSSKAVRVESCGFPPLSPSARKGWG